MSCEHNLSAPRQRPIAISAARMAVSRRSTRSEDNATLQLTSSRLDTVACGCVAVIYRQVPTLNIAGLIETLVERRDQGRRLGGRPCWSRNAPHRTADTTSESRPWAGGRCRPSRSPWKFHDPCSGTSPSKRSSKIVSRLAELGKKSDTINRLKAELPS